MGLIGRPGPQSHGGKSTGAAGRDAPWADAALIPTNKTSVNFDSILRRLLGRFQRYLRFLHAICS